MVSKSVLYLALLAIGLSVSVAKAADIVARVPSNYYRGVKWVLFRDDSIPDPPPNVIQAEDGVQVLPTYRYQQSRYQNYFIPRTSIHLPASVQVQSVPVHVPLQIPVQPSVRFNSQPVSPGLRSVHFNEFPISEAPATVQVTSTPTSVHFNTEVIESKSRKTDQKSEYQIGESQVAQQQHQFNQQYERKVQEIVGKAPIIDSFGVTAVPHSAVHVSSPSFVDLLRKKKSD